MIDIKGINKAKLLASLYNEAKVQGMGFLHADNNDMSEAEAKEILQSGTSFDYLKGRVMKIDVGNDTMQIDLYDRDNGAGVAEKIVNRLR